MHMVVHTHIGGLGTTLNFLLVRFLLLRFDTMPSGHKISLVTKDSVREPEVYSTVTSIVLGAFVHDCYRFQNLQS